MEVKDAWLTDKQAAREDAKQPEVVNLTPAASLPT